MKAFTLIGLLIISQLALGQRTEMAVDFNQKTNRLVIEIENDLLFKSDHYYTSGTALTYLNKKMNHDPAQLILKSKNPESIRFSGFGLEQRIFTPYSILRPDSIEDDRPYSAYLLATNFSVLINPEKHLKISNELGIGVMGPAAGGEWAQTTVHKIIGSPIPLGWENQLNNTFLIDYQFRIEKGFFGDWTANHFIPFAKARVGTLTDRIGLGLLIKFGNVNKTLGEYAQPKKYKNRLVWQWVFEANLQGVFYDATLQGGLFSTDEAIDLPTQDIISRQYQVRTGVNIYYKSFYIRYMIKFNSQDFINGVIHRYGGLNIGFSF
ncbi:MAG: lipid A deacylase LpxR family protein [Bacteroidales bacterium]|nr:lipid A deacylase LpxR family protein [Bacteroidales bacterium]